MATTRQSQEEYSDSNPNFRCSCIMPSAELLEGAAVAQSQVGGGWEVAGAHTDGAQRTPKWQQRTNAQDMVS